MSEHRTAFPEDSYTHMIVNISAGLESEEIATVTVSPASVSRHPAFVGLLSVAVRAVADPGDFDKMLPHHEEQRVLIEAVKAFVDKETELAAARKDGEP